MIENFDYLSDEELQNLISSTEESGMMQAPPDFENSVIQTISFRNKQKEYKRFRFQVCMAMAAAILFMFVVPAFIGDNSISNITTDFSNHSTAVEMDNSFLSDILSNHSFSNAITGLDIIK